MVEVGICTTMALQNLQQYGCQTMFGSGYENCPEFGVLGGVIFKLDIL
jgi:hypothetical protein